MPYVDGFLLPLPKDNVEAYRKQAEAAGKIWREHGALGYHECLAEDMDAQGLVAFPQAIGAKEDETVVFAYIVYESRQHRDEVNAKVMSDPRLKSICDSDNPPFDYARMAYGGFKTLVNL